MKNRTKGHRLAFVALQPMAQLARTGVRNALVAAIAVSLPFTPIVAGIPTIGQNFDGQDPNWRAAGREGAIIAQTRIQGGARGAGQCDRVIVAGPAGSSVLLKQAIQRVAVVDELEARLWIKSHRPAIQLAALVTLPRSTDRDGRPLTAIVRGDSYGRPGYWQQLSLTGVPRLLAGEVRALRTVPSAKVDPREAYVDAILLVVPGEPKGIEVFTDELVTEGVLLPEPRPVELTSIPNPVPTARSDEQSATSQRAIGADFSTAAASSVTATRAPVQRHGASLMADGKPFMPRAIDWNGEPFEFLADLGFNTVRIAMPPTPEQVAEAQRRGLWFLCPPPSPDAIGDGAVGSVDDRVLAWLLDDDAIDVNPNYGRIWANLVRERDAARGRPIVVAPPVRWRSSAHLADVLLAAHPRGGSIAVPQFDAWLFNRAQIDFPGTLRWIDVACDFSEKTVEQVAAFTGEAAAPPMVDPDRMFAMAELACLRGFRGVVITSRSPLHDDSPPARRRAVLLELLNRRLQLLEPWVTSGKVVGQIESSDAQKLGFVMLADRARLLVPVANELLSTGAQRSPQSEDSHSVGAEFTVPGVPESSQIYWMTSGSFRRLAGKRVAGGTRFGVPATEGGMVLITEDPQIVQAFRARIAHDMSRVARLQCDAAEHRANLIAEVGQELAQLGLGNSLVDQQVAAVRSRLRECESLLSSGRAEAAYELAQTQYQLMRQVEAAQQQIVEGPMALSSHPLAITFEQLPALARFMRSFKSRPRGDNLLYGGDFEDVGQLMQLGWQHAAISTPEYESYVTLTAKEPHHGTYCLELSNRPSKTAGPQHADPQTPITIISHAISGERGQIIEVTGWVRIDEPIAGSADGLQITDSLGGPELAISVRQTSGWQPFRILRGVPEPTELRLIFSLTGAGTAYVDSVMVRTLEQPKIRRLPPVAPRNENGQVTANN